MRLTSVYCWLMVPLVALVMGCVTKDSKMGTLSLVYEAYNHRASMEELASRSRAIMGSHRASVEGTVQVLPSEFGDMWRLMQEAWRPWGGVRSATMVVGPDGGNALTIELAKGSIFVHVLREPWVQMGDNYESGVYLLVEKVLRVAPGVFIDQIGIASAGAEGRQSKSRSP